MHVCSINTDTTYHQMMFGEEHSLSQDYDPGNVYTVPYITRMNARLPR